MTYVLIIISFVAMGGPKATTPTIDHIAFPTEQSCQAAKSWIAQQINNKVHHSMICQIGS